MSDFNKVLAFQQAAPYLNKEQQEHFAATLGMTIEEIERRLVGKNKEDEFILILLLMEVCENITAFDEGVSQLLSTATSDLLIEMKDGRKFMLEIKHTDKECYSISKGNLNKRIEYAHKYGLTLYFAISIKGYWMMFDENYMLEKNGKIDITDLTKSDLDEMLSCYSYIFPEDIRIKSVYSKNYKKSIGIHFEPYGELVSYELYCGQRRIFRVKGKNSQYIIYTVILEALQDELANDTQEIINAGEFTVINESFSRGLHAISEYRFLLSYIEHTSKEPDTKYTAHSFIENAKVDKSLLDNRIQLGHIRGIIQYLANMGIDMMYVWKNQIYKIPPNNINNKA